MYLDDMAGHASRKISLPPDLEDFVASRVASGRYASEGEVVREGLRLLAERERAQGASGDTLRDAIAVGLEQARRGELIDGEEVFQSLEERIRSERQASE
ncbi:MAG TPA: type II toxin-antitoxin system ParD family antitoxin [Thermoanaerobaculia bacterium]